VSEGTFQPTWAILELMGHRRLGGMVSEATIGGASMIRIDVPETPNQPAFTQYYGGSALYCLTPTTEEIATAVAERSVERPVSRYELKPLPAPVIREEDYSDDDDTTD
jgi:hypothetical protein